MAEWELICKYILNINTFLHTFTFGMSTLMLYMLVNPKAGAKASLVRLALSDKINSLLFFIGHLLTIFSAITLYKWFVHSSLFSDIVNYVIPTISFANASVAFSILAYSLQVNDDKSFTTQNDLSKSLNQRVSSRSISNIEFWKRQRESLVNIKGYLQRQLISYDVNQLSRAYKNTYLVSNVLPPYREYSFYSIKDTAIFVVVCKVKPLFGKLRYEFDFIYENYQFPVQPVLKVDVRNTGDISIQEVISLGLDEAVKQIDNEFISYHQVLLESYHIDYEIFAYYYFMQILGTSQSFLIPLNRKARLLNSLFAVYKFLALGVLISLIVKQMSNR